MPKMTTTDATIHATHYLMYALQNIAPEIPPVKLVNTHKEALISLAEIFRKSTSPAVPLRVLIRKLYQ